MEQYIAEHPMSPKSALVYKPTIKKLQRYEAYKREMEGKKGFTLYCETIRPEEYLDFREYVINEYVHYNDYPEFYEQFSLDMHPPKQMSSTQIIGIMHHLRIVGHWCIKMGFTTNRSCDAFTIPAALQGTPFYLTIEERDKVYNANLHNKPELEVYRGLFIFQSMVGCRVGDLFSFTKDNIVGDILQYLPHKTMRKRSQTVSVPLTTKAMEILKSYDGKQEKLLPTKQVYQYNEGIRAVLRECGINRMVTILDTVTGKEVQKPICDVATSHMARRNFIGNLYKKVKDPELVSSMTGHVNGSRAFATFEMPKVLDSPPFYLTLEERDKVYYADLSNETPSTQVYRDIFMFHCLIGCRVGDLEKMTRANIVDGAVEYIAEKTKNHKPRTIRVPLNDKAKAILAKYADLETMLLPKINQNIYNRQIKKILKQLGIDRMVTVIDNKTREPIQKPICDIATSHTARKTFIGNLYKKVKDPNLVASLSGHTDGSRAFARYREIDNEMKRELVKLID